MKIKLFSVAVASAIIALASCKSEGVTYEQVVVNHTDTIITINEGSASCGSHTFVLNPNEEKIIHSNRVVNAPSTCEDHHYQYVSGPTNVPDISSLENWQKIEQDDKVRCEFVFERRADCHTTTQPQGHVH